MTKTLEDWVQHFDNVAQLIAQQQTSGNHGQALPEPLYLDGNIRDIKEGPKGPFAFILPSTEQVQQGQNVFAAACSLPDEFLNNLDGSKHVLYNSHAEGKNQLFRDYFQEHFTLMQQQQVAAGPIPVRFRLERNPLDPTRIQASCLFRVNLSVAPPMNVVYPVHLRPGNGINGDTSNKNAPTNAIQQGATKKPLPSAGGVALKGPLQNTFNPVATAPLKEMLGFRDRSPRRTNSNNSGGGGGGTGGAGGTPAATTVQQHQQMLTKPKATSSAGAGTTTSSAAQLGGLHLGGSNNNINNIPPPQPHLLHNGAGAPPPGLQLPSLPGTATSALQHGSLLSQQHHQLLGPTPGGSLAPLNTVPPANYPQQQALQLQQSIQHLQQQLLAQQQQLDHQSFGAGGGGPQALYNNGLNLQLDSLLHPGTGSTNLLPGQHNQLVQPLPPPAAPPGSAAAGGGGPAQRKNTLSSTCSGAAATGSTTTQAPGVQLPHVDQQTAGLMLSQLQQPLLYPGSTTTAFGVGATTTGGGSARLLNPAAASTTTTSSSGRYKSEQQLLAQQLIPPPAGTKGSAASKSSAGGGAVLTADTIPALTNGESSSTVRKYNNLGGAGDGKDDDEMNSNDADEDRRKGTRRAGRGLNAASGPVFSENTMEYEYDMNITTFWELYVEKKQQLQNFKEKKNQRKHRKEQLQNELIPKVEDELQALQRELHELEQTELDSKVEESEEEKFLMDELRNMQEQFIGGGGNDQQYDDDGNNTHFAGKTSASHELYS
ncbi:unnamed protein product [Amoebophrya sp. A120]|nr:unnamed protein product [Amoebophrya sp. A120]|eukprot:GSA120T00016461001.1